MNNPWILALLGVFVLSFILILAWMLKMERHQKKIKRERAAALGFTPLPHPDPELVDKILALYPLRPGQRRELRHLFIRRSLNMTLVMFDLFAVKGESTTLLAESAVAAVFDVNDGQPRFPALTIMPRMDEDKINTRSNPWLLAMALAGQRVIAFADVPAFTGRVNVLINEESAAESLRLESQVRRFLNANLRTCLSQLNPVQIEAGGSMLALSSLDIAVAWEEQKLELLRCLIDEALKVAGWFESESLRSSGSPSAGDPVPTLPIRTPAPEIPASTVFMATKSTEVAASAIISASTISGASAPTVTPIEAPFANGYFYRVTVDRPTPAD